MSLKELYENVDIGLNDTLANGLFSYVAMSCGFYFNYVFNLIYTPLFRGITFFDLLMYILKYVPTSICSYKFLKNMVVTYRERINRKQKELNEIKEQIQLINIKLSERDTELSERAEQLRQGVEKLHKIRTRIREIIANEEEDEKLNKDDYSPKVGDMGDASSCGDMLSDREFFMDCLSYFRTYKGQLKKSLHTQSSSSDSRNHSVSSKQEYDLNQEYCLKVFCINNEYVQDNQLYNNERSLAEKMSDLKNVMIHWQTCLKKVTEKPFLYAKETSQEAMGDYITMDTNQIPNIEEYIISCDANRTKGVYDFYDYNRSMDDYYFDNGGKLSSLEEETDSQIAIAQSAN